jgi:hypothetical protein
MAAVMSVQLNLIEETDIIKVQQAVQDAIPSVDSSCLVKQSHQVHIGCLIILMITTRTLCCSASLFEKTPLLGSL